LKNYKYDHGIHGKDIQSKTDNLTLPMVFVLGECKYEV